MRRAASVFILGLIITFWTGEWAGSNAHAQASKAETKPAAGGTESVKPAGKLPEAKEILAKFVKAMGGEAAFAKVKSQHAKGSFQMEAQGLDGDLEVFSARPNKLLVEITIPGIGKMLQGYDGKTGWNLSAATGPILIDGKQLVQMREQADFESALHKPELYKTMETLEETTFEGRTAYKLKLVRTSGTEVTEFYDKQTGLLIGSTLSQETVLGPMTVTNTIGEYKKFGDLMFPTKITQKVGPIEQTMILKSYEFNTVEPSKFDLPEEIKALSKSSP